MTISAPSIDPHEGSGVDRRTAGADARQPEHIAAKRLARGYIPALCAGVSIPPLVFFAAVLPLDATGVIAVIAWVSVEVCYIVNVLIGKQVSLNIGARKWETMRRRALELEEAYETSEVSREWLQDQYNDLYAEHLLQRGVASLMAKRSGRGAAADSPSGVNGSAAVVPLKPKGAGA